jgi:hypothetical protein
MSDKIKEFFSNLSSHDLPTGGAVLVGVILLFLMFKSAKMAKRLLFLAIAVGLFAAAWWWHTRR